jgi:hypothetical protein
MSPEIKERGIDLMSPIGHVLESPRCTKRSLYAWLTDAEEAYGLLGLVEVVCRIPLPPFEFHLQFCCWDRDAIFGNAGLVKQIESAPDARRPVLPAQEHNRSLCYSSTHGTTVASPLPSARAQFGGRSDIESHLYGKD